MYKYCAAFSDYFYASGYDNSFLTDTQIKTGAADAGRRSYYYIT